jgi:hypothetical protein
MDKDSIFTGLVAGAIVPVLGFIVLDYIFTFLGMKGYIPDGAIVDMERRMKTIGLIALCCNIIPFEICRKNRYDATMRGVVFPTLIYVGCWVYKYYDTLFI